MNDPTAIASILERAADLIVVDGWKQGDWGSPGGPRCAEGHLQSAVNERLGVQLTPNQFTDLFYDAINLIYHTVGRAVTDWNDDEERTADEVRDLFLTAAKTIRNGETP